MTRRYGLKDEEFTLIADLLPPVGRPGGRWNDHRTTLDGVLQILHTGAQWRELPERYGKWKSVYDRFNRRPAEGLDLYDPARPARVRGRLPAHPHLVPHRQGAPQAQGRARGRRRPGRRAQEKLIEAAYLAGEAMGPAVWCTDQAGPYQAIPYAGQSWRPAGEPARQPHEHLRDGTAKALTLFHPADGHARVRGVTACPNAVLRPWLKRELTAVLDALPAPSPEPAAGRRPAWERWQEGLSIKPTLPADPPPLRMLLVLDDLAGHKTPELVCRLFAHGVMPLYTPVGGSWLNMAESLQRILKRRALDGQYPADAAQIIAWYEAAARHWDAAPTPFVWGGKRAAHRRRQRERRHRLGGSGAGSCAPGPTRCGIMATDGPSDPLVG